MQTGLPWDYQGKALTATCPFLRLRRVPLELPLSLNRPDLSTANKPNMVFMLARYGIGKPTTISPVM